MPRNWDPNMTRKDREAWWDEHDRYGYLRPLKTPSELKRARIWNRIGIGIFIFVVLVLPIVLAII